MSKCSSMRFSVSYRRISAWAPLLVAQPSRSALRRRLCQMGPPAPGRDLDVAPGGALEDFGLHLAVHRHGFIDALAEAPVGGWVNQFGAGLLVAEALDGAFVGIEGELVEGVFQARGVLGGGFLGALACRWLRCAGSCRPAAECPSPTTPNRCLRCGAPSLARGPGCAPSRMRNSRSGGRIWWSMKTRTMPERGQFSVLKTASVGTSARGRKSCTRPKASSRSRAESFTAVQA